MPCVGQARGHCLHNKSEQAGRPSPTVRAANSESREEIIGESLIYAPNAEEVQETADFFIGM